MQRTLWDCSWPSKRLDALTPQCRHVCMHQVVQLLANSAMGAPEWVIGFAGTQSYVLLLKKPSTTNGSLVAPQQNGQRASLCKRQSCSASRSVHHTVTFCLAIHAPLSTHDLRLTIMVPLQRFNQANLLKRTIFELIAEELLQTLMPESRDPSSHGSMPVGGATIG